MTGNCHVWFGGQGKSLTPTNAFYWYFRFHRVGTSHGARGHCAKEY